MTSRKKRPILLSMTVGMLLWSSAAGACLPSVFWGPHNSTDVAEGVVVARHGRIQDIPVPLSVARLMSAFVDIGEGVAVVSIDRIVKGTSPKVIVVSQGLYGVGFLCRDSMPQVGDRVLLSSGPRNLTTSFGSFFEPFGFSRGSYEDNLERQRQRSQF